jgi:hypothetical protein
MSDITQHVAIIIGVLFAFFVGPVIAIIFLLRRKRRARARRRSPIGIDLLRSPGHSLREELEESTSDVLFDITLLMVVPLLILSLFLAQSHVLGLQGMMHLVPIYVVVALGFVACTVIKPTR